MTYDIVAVKAANRLSEVIAELTNQTPRRVGQEHKFLCVFHSDKNPSLYANDEKDGGVWCCRSCGAKGDAIDFVQQYRNVDFQSALEFLGQRGGVTASPLTPPMPQSVRHEPCPSPIGRDAIEREHLYRRDGVVIARKVLLKARDAAGKKVMRWQRPDGRGRWIDGLDGLEPGLYGLDKAKALKGSGGLLWCEGEKDVDAALAAGIPAVCTPHGAAGKLLPSYVEGVIAAGFTKVFVFGDQDAAGQTYNERVTPFLQSHGVSDARPVPWDADHAEGYDVADFLAAHPTDGKKRLLKRCVAAEPWKASEPTSASTPDAPGPVVVNLGSVKPEPIAWLWRGRLARGKVTVIGGDPGLGKSFITLDLAARLTTGRAWPDGEPSAGIGGVILLAAEDGLADTVRPRLDAMGGDSQRVDVLQAIRVADGSERGVSLQTDLMHLEAAIRRTGATLVVIDPISNYLGKVDSYRDAEVRQVLTPLATLAERTGIAIVLVMHLTKDQKAAALYRMNGSIAFGGVARIVLAVGTDPDEPNPYAPGVTRALAGVKSNNSVVAPAWTYRLVEDPPQGDIRVGHVEWIAERNDISPDTLIAGPAKRENKDGPDPQAFVCSYLADGRELPVKVVEEAAAREGISHNQLYRARRQCCDNRRDGGLGGDGHWVCRLKPEFRADAKIAAESPTDGVESLYSPHSAILGKTSPVSPLESTALSKTCRLCNLRGLCNLRQRPHAKAP
jgi:hypothetical protein